MLIVFDDAISDKLINKKHNPIVTELFRRGRKLNISLVFISQSYFAERKKYQIKFYVLFYYENSIQTRTSTNGIYPFIRY